MLKIKEYNMKTTTILCLIVKLFYGRSKLVGKRHAKN